MPFLKVLAIGLFLSAVASCDRPTVEKLNQWEKTEKGPAKLQRALENSELDLGLRVQAAHHLVHLGKTHEVMDVIQALEASKQADVIDGLVKRIWVDARINGSMDVPTLRQEQAKDMLFNLRRLAKHKSVDAIDRHLVVWLTDGYYEGRAQAGTWPGSEILRTIGPSAAPLLLKNAQQTLGEKSDLAGKKKSVGDRTLLGLAMTGDLDSLRFLLKVIASENTADKSLAQRAMTAFHLAYVDLPVEKRANPKSLSDIKRELFNIAESKTMKARFVNDAIDIISVMPVSDCLPLFINMVSNKRGIEPYRWIGTQRAIQCGGTIAIAPILEALPEDESYEKHKLDKYLWAEILKIEDKKGVARELGRVLDSSSWVAQASAIEVLMASAYGPMASENAKKISTLKGKTRILRGWKDVKSDRKTLKLKEPTLGEIATEAAALLERVANRG